ncbi:P-loop containing nucleoside triphosphate hydrolase protein [Lophiostoma macrostomum CBS 122681]|uniref:P-loop containing nucleoside triphosphate hydrolase protein n=1 Tax=Lophiostoma macrostomum CBS 122681 TaxID=1314788 RepID=A0A6A6TJF2_9PLEO|nr:P-loop containing nucleoside triphosphate hydrolase protein [Lophiostoma macrostomum CBS 122681]
MPSHTLLFTVSPQARSSYLALASIARRSFSGTAQQSSGQYHRNDFTGQSWTSSYEPGQPTGGPLGGASNVGAPRMTPKALKQHLDKYVVGQERPKKALSTAIYNHYQTKQEIQRQKDEQASLEAQALRREMAFRHPIEDEFPGQQPTVKLFQPPPPQSQPQLETPVFSDTTPLQIDKSNILILGPSGVGKTLMAKTLARVLDVPFSISDCTPFTSSGYVGEDVDACVQRLLAKANYDIKAAEHGIIFLDEIDKITGTKPTHGKDIGGEGVQQALLKILEGTTLQIKVKERSGSRQNPSNTTGISSGGMIGPSGGQDSKEEIFNVSTDNILFICSGAFQGLHKIIAARVFSGGMGFGAKVRSSHHESGVHETLVEGDDAVFRKHLPYFVPSSEPAPSPGGDPFSSPPPARPQARQRFDNILDLVQVEDLQKFGMIPELLGRIGTYCAVHALDEEALVRVLTEPRNSLVRQYEAKFKLSGIELRFTSSALRVIARSASGMGTGARGLRTVIERLLFDAMFETPGSPVKHVLITQDVAELKAAPLYFQRGQAQQFNAAIAAEEEKREEELRSKENAGVVKTFEQYRKKGLVAGAGG